MSVSATASSYAGVLSLVLLPYKTPSLTSHSLQTSRVRDASLCSAIDHFRHPQPQPRVHCASNPNNTPTHTTLDSSSSPTVHLVSSAIETQALPVKRGDGSLHEGDDTRFSDSCGQLRREHEFAIQKPDPSCTHLPRYTPDGQSADSIAGDVSTDQADICHPTVQSTPHGSSALLLPSSPELELAWARCQGQRTPDAYRDATLSDGSSMIHPNSPIYSSQTTPEPVHTYLPPEASRFDGPFSPSSLSCNGR